MLWLTELAPKRAGRYTGFCTHFKSHLDLCAVYCNHYGKRSRRVRALDWRTATKRNRLRRHSLNGVDCYVVFDVLLTVLSVCCSRVDSVLFTQALLFMWR